MVEFKKQAPDNSHNPWVTHSIDLKYDNPWIRITHRTVTNPSGGPGIYGVVHFKNVAIGILPLDEHYNTWLVGQYRYTLNQYCWEIPEGGCPEGYSFLEAAQRELLEETGITASEWIPLLETHISNSVTDEYGVCFVARGLQYGESAPEETEDLQVRKIPFEAAVEMVLNGEITDSLSVMAILKTQEFMRRNLL